MAGARLTLIVAALFGALVTAAPASAQAPSGSCNLAGTQGTKQTYRKKLTVPGTYQLFCGLHPVDMTATVKVVRKRRN